MNEWEPIYLCFRTDTKSKASHASCRQYIFKSIADLRKWLNARKNSAEQIKILYCPTRSIDRETTITGTRKDLAARIEWPMEATA